MLRISTVESSEQLVTVRVEGQLVGPRVSELARPCERALGEGKQLALDLSGVSFVDAAGIRLLRELRARRASLESCTPFVAEQLKGVVPC